MAQEPKSIAKMRSNSPSGVPVAFTNIEGLGVSGQEFSILLRN